MNNEFYKWVLDEWKRKGEPEVVYTGYGRREFLRLWNYSTLDAIPMKYFQRFITK